MIEFLQSTLRLSTPLIFAGLGGFFCEKAGISTICLEGVMLTAAFTSAIFNYYLNDPYTATLLGVTTGIFTMWLHAFLTIKAKANHIVSGVAVNLFAAGITPLISKSLFSSPTNTPSIDMIHRYQTISIPLLDQIPYLGPVLFSNKPLIYLALILPFLVHYFTYHTGLGLRLQAVGEKPEAVETAGISVIKTRFLFLTIGGAITALGGIYLSISHSSQFTRDMTAGRGFIALAALILGKWKPIPCFFACLLFGVTDALQIRMQSTTIFDIQFPVQVIQALPYLVTLFVLVGFVGEARPPQALVDGK